MFGRFVRFFWGDMSGDELKKFGILSATLMVILGNYWMLRVMKNALFGRFVDFQLYQPYVKIFSLFVVVFVVMAYSKLVDLFEKDKLFYILSGFFGFWILGLSYFIAYPHLVSVSETSAFYPLVSWIPGKALGWIIYVSFESISIIIALFWAFVASTTKTESAKRGYGMIVFFTQIATISGPAIVTNFSKTLGLPIIVAFGGVLLLCVSLLIKLYMTVVPQELAAPSKSAAKKEKTGFFEGLRILLTKPYVMGIFVVSTFYEVIGTILEFQMNSLGHIIYPIAEEFAAFNGKFGMSVNTLALVFALLGTSFFMRKFGLRFCLIAFPTAIGVIVTSIFVVNSFGASHYHIMWALFAGMVGIKGFNYALNNPTKEVMYIPTSKDVKFKAKGWIDTFGNRTTKAGGSGVNAVFAKSLEQLLVFGTVISLGIVGAWIVVAMLLGKKFEKLQEDKTIIE